MTIARASGHPSVPVSFCAKADRRTVLWAAILASSMGFIDSSVTAIAMPAMRTALGATLAQAQWINAAYLLALSALVLVGGAAGDRFGTARVFVIGIWVFVLASLACAAAQDAGQMIAARTVKGIGAALMVPGSMAMVSRAYPRAERGRALGLWAAASTMTTALGPVLGGALITWGGEAGWRLIFALNLPLGLLAVWLIRGRTPGDRGQPGIRVDALGAVLASAGLGLLAWALIAPGASLVVWAVAGATLAGFLAWERVAPAPMLRLGLFRNRTLAVTNLVTLALYFALNGVMFYLPMTAVSAWGVSALEVTAAFLPISLMIAVLSAPAGRLADRWGAGVLMAAGSTLVACAYAGLWLAAPGGQFWALVVPLTALAGLGLGLVVAPLTAAAMQGAEDGEQGAASGINNAVARVAGLVAVALLGRVAASAYGPGAPGFGVTGTGAAHLAATGAAFGTVALVASLAAALAALLALLVARPVR
ncbi:MFS transporter [Tabrizicola aquatica]|uniref:MFS transporter n=1 Tax=Tabrizicola aquatica TaxID=909926 RepID=UPI000CD1A0E0|nr:MFS transporter [Tabrizicola aquatica]